MQEQYYKEIKEILTNNEINKKVKEYSKNKVELESYYNVGKMLFEAGKHYGEGIIKEYSNKLTKELGKGYSISSLKRMRQFYYLFEKGASMVHQLTWTHITILLPINDINKINYYINQIKERNLSVRELRKIIKEQEYERLSESTKEKLKTNENLSLIDTIKDLKI